MHFFTQSGKIYTWQKVFTQTCLWCLWQIWGTGYKIQERWGRGWCSNFYYSWLQELLNNEAECTVQATFPDFQVAIKWGRLEAVWSILNALHLLIQICISSNYAFVPLAPQRRHHTDNFQMCRGLWSFLLPKPMQFLH